MRIVSPALLVLLIITTPIVIQDCEGEGRGEPYSGMFVSDILPVDHGWSDKSHPEIHFSLDQSSVNIENIQFILLGDDFTRIIVDDLLILNSSRYVHSIDIELEEGRYLWMLNITPEGNEAFQEGPWYFSIDTTPPTIDTVGDHYFTDLRTMELEISSDDSFSGVRSHTMEFFLPNSTGWEPLSSSILPLDPEGKYQISIEGNISSPVYFRTYSTDQAGNAGPHSPIIRSDPSWFDFDVRNISGKYTGPNRTLEFIISDHLGIDMDTLQYKGSGHVGAWLDVPDFVILAGPTSRPGYAEGPLSIMVTLIPESGASIRNYTFRWADLAPLSYIKVSTTRDVIFIGLPPILGIDAPRFVQESRVRLSLYIEWGMEPEEMFEIMIRKDGEPWHTMDNGSYISSQIHHGWRVDVEVSLDIGTEERFHFKVLDHANNTAYANCTVRATRPPIVSITGLYDERIEQGTLARLISETQDPDNDTLEIRWYLDGVLVWTGGSYSVMLDPGFHNISVNASDGAFFDTDTLTLYVDRKKDPVHEGSESNPLLMILVIVIAIVLFTALGAIIVIGKISRTTNGTKKKVEHVRSGKTPTLSRRSRFVEDVCELCLEPLEEDVVECSCGAKFHEHCASRIGTCPSCKREILI
ncbi:MAG: hypothetical protein U9R75_08670 [Candidatus Thermoplasmatota archaeon]|nr:hypothetical protein [Candidatus Thermoplasmatota archaeon]